MGLSTHAPRLLHKCGENDTISVLKLILLWLLCSINDPVTSCAVWTYRRNCDLYFAIKGNVWWKRTFIPMATISLCYIINI